MKPVNWGRVILGGIAAGVVINLSEWVLNEVVLKKQNEEAMKALGKSGTGSIAPMIEGDTALICSVTAFTRALSPSRRPSPVFPTSRKAPSTSAVVFGRTACVISTTGSASTGGRTAMV